jgi:polysaccharide export outer membrane protein
LSPTQAGRQVEKALSDGKFLLKPHVTIAIAQSRSQRVSVLGEVHAPGRYTVETNTTLFDVLAQAGGGTENCADMIYVMRPEADGTVRRFAVDLKGLADGMSGSDTQTVRGGDTVYVPRADQFYIYGEVQQPNMYKIEHGMTVVQAIARAGGVTARGSDRRIEVRRRGKDGQSVVSGTKLTDPVQPDDVIRVKDSIF